MEILRNLVLFELTASEKAEDSSGDMPMPVGADMVVVRVRDAGRLGAGVEASLVRSTGPWWLRRTSRARRHRGPGRVASFPASLRSTQRTGRRPSTAHSALLLHALWLLSVPTNGGVGLSCVLSLHLETFLPTTTVAGTVWRWIPVLRSIDVRCHLVHV